MFERKCKIVFVTPIMFLLSITSEKVSKGLQITTQMNYIRRNLVNKMIDHNPYKRSLEVQIELSIFILLKNFCILYVAIELLRRETLSPVHSLV